MMDPDDLPRIDKLRVLLSVADDPEHEARRQRVIWHLLGTLPKVQKEIIAEAREARRNPVRAALRYVLASRRLVSSEQDDARIQACTDFPTLERWFERAFTARSLAEVFE
jgi:hypothetical protein